MAIHACIENITVVKIIDVLNESEYIDLSSKYSNVIDISQNVLPIGIGWRLVGVEFQPPISSTIPIEKIIASRIRTYQKLAPELILDLYVTNTIAGITTEQSDQMFSDYSDVLIRLREGAWPTALFRLSQKSPSGFVTQELIEQWLLKINEKLTEVIG